jgi:type II secretory pathway pseudopilin PulG
MLFMILHHPKVGVFVIGCEGVAASDKCPRFRRITDGGKDWSEAGRHELSMTNNVNSSQSASDQELDMSGEGRLGRGINLIELVIIVVILAIIGAIAIPKMSRGGDGAGETVLIQDLSILRGAVDAYNSDHPLAQLNSKTSAIALTNALTLYSDANGNTGVNKTGMRIYGPYLKSFPSLPIGTNKNCSAVTVTGSLGAGGYAWYFNGTTFLCNNPAKDMDASGNPYNGY